MANTQKGGKKGRKIGRNKVACDTYERMGRLEKNKKRAAKRVERERVKKDLKVELRIKAGKPVPSKHKARMAGTSNGTVILLPDVTTGEGCAAAMHQLGLTAKDCTVDWVVVEDDQGKVTHKYRLVMTKGRGK